MWISVGELTKSVDNFEPLKPTVIYPLKSKRIKTQYLTHHVDRSIRTYYRYKKKIGAALKVQGRAW